MFGSLDYFKPFFPDAPKERPKQIHKIKDFTCICSTDCSLNFKNALKRGLTPKIHVLYCHSRLAFFLTVYVFGSLDYFKPFFPDAPKCLAHFVLGKVAGNKCVCVCVSVCVHLAQSYV